MRVAICWFSTDGTLASRRCHQIHICSAIKRRFHLAIHNQWGLRPLVSQLFTGSSGVLVAPVFSAHRHPRLVFRGVNLENGVIPVETDWEKQIFQLFRNYKKNPPGQLRAWILTLLLQWASSSLSGQSLTLSHHWDGLTHLPPFRHNLPSKHMGNTATRTHAARITILDTLLNSSTGQRDFDMTNWGKHLTYWNTRWGSRPSPRSVARWGRCTEWEATDASLCLSWGEGTDTDAVNLKVDPADKLCQCAQSKSVSLSMKDLEIRKVNDLVSIYVWD